MTVVSFPARMGWKTERRGSAFWRTERTLMLLGHQIDFWLPAWRHTSGCCLQTTEGALPCCNERSASENSESSLSEGTTDTITSEAKCAMRATGRVSVGSFVMLPHRQLHPMSLGCNEVVGWARGGRTSLASSRNGTHCDCNNTESESSGGIVYGEGEIK